MVGHVVRVMEKPPRPLKKRGVEHPGMQMILGRVKEYHLGGVSIRIPRSELMGERESRLEGAPCGTGGWCGLASGYRTSVNRDPAFRILAAKRRSVAVGVPKDGISWDNFSLASVGVESI